MSDKISLPHVNMRTVAKQIIDETDALMSETASRQQQIQSTKAELPASMQSAFDNFLDPFQRNMQQVLTLRQSIGKTLTSAADVAESSDGSISTGFQNQ